MKGDLPPAPGRVSKEPSQDRKDAAEHTLLAYKAAQDIALVDLLPPATPPHKAPCLALTSLFLYLRDLNRR
eukprot:gene11427-17113_t